MRSHGWVLIQSEWCPPKKRQFELTERDQRCTGTEGRPCEGVARVWPSASQGEGPQGKITLPTPWSWASRLQDYEKINFCYLSHLACVWYFVMVPLENEYSTFQKTLGLWHSLKRILRTLKTRICLYHASSRAPALHLYGLTVGPTISQPGVKAKAPQVHTWAWGPMMSHILSSHGTRLLKTKYSDSCLTGKKDFFQDYCNRGQKWLQEGREVDLNS